MTLRTTLLSACERQRFERGYRNITERPQITPVVRIELPPGSYIPEFHWSLLSTVNGERLKETVPPKGGLAMAACASAGHYGLPS